MNNGWTAEIKIPFSAVRFPDKDVQLWGLQITRAITRNGEFDQWGLVAQGASNPFKYWGYLKGLEKIKQPVRLSLSPYITLAESHYPANIPGQSNYSFSFNRGLDLKYGITKSFTVDAMLLPDFTQVQSDNVVKNLSPFEIQYNEQRPFFQESTDLFQKGNLFYSRRIGKQPTEYYNIYSDTSKNKVILTNPTAARLINATKVSGRTKDGLGIGLLNAVLANTYATARDSMGNKSKILTEPFSNYNIVVLDQQLKHGSDVYLINTNVNRTHGYNNANVTGAGFYLNDKKSAYAVWANFALSDVISKADSVPNYVRNNYGFRYDVAVGKMSGRFNFYAFRNAIDNKFDDNDMGINQTRNYNINGLDLTYNWFKPFGKFLNASINTHFEHQENFTTHQLSNMGINFFTHGTFINHYNALFGGYYQLTPEIDYYEARTPGRIFVRIPHYYVFYEVDSDLRKKFSYAINGHVGTTALVSPTIGYNRFWELGITPHFRATDKLTLELSSDYAVDNGDRGFVGYDEWGTIIFGKRIITDFTNVLSAKYLFRNNLSLSVRVRHYWERGHYLSYYDLKGDGYLIDNISYNENHDFNFNAFNVDMVFQWQFAPGSTVNLVWKNSIYNNGDVIINDYSDNFRTTINSNQLNTVSLKVLYYLDYLYLQRRKNKS